MQINFTFCIVNSRQCETVVNFCRIQLSVVCFFTECKLTDHGLTYQGRVSVTVSSVTKNNIPCQRWDSHSPHSHTLDDDSLFPDGSVADAANFCRNPDDEDPEGPWCYTSDPAVRWQYCNVLRCGK